MKTRFLLFFLISGVCGYLCPLVFEHYFHVNYVGARSIREVGFSQIAKETLGYYWLDLVPFLAVGISASFLKRTSLAFFTISMALLIWREWDAAAQSEKAMQAHAWTGGALNAGFSFLLNLLLVGALITGFRFFEARRLKDRDTLSSPNTK